MSDASDPAELAIVRETIMVAPISPTRLVDHIEIRRIAIAANQPAGLHVHNGPVVGSILSGSAIYQIEGQPETVLRPGEVFFEPEGARIARFDAGVDGVVFLAYFPLGVGEAAELSYPDA